MDIDVLKKSKEPLMNRTYFEAKVVFSGKTPSRLEMQKDLCKKLESKDELTIVRTIKTDYGTERALIAGYVYDNDAAIKNVENKHYILRHLPKAEQQAAKEKAKADKQAAKAAAQGSKKKK